MYVCVCVCVWAYAPHSKADSTASALSQAEYRVAPLWPPPLPVCPHLSLLSPSHTHTHTHMSITPRPLCSKTQTYPLPYPLPTPYPVPGSQMIFGIFFCLILFFNFLINSCVCPSVGLLVCLCVCVYLCVCIYCVYRFSIFTLPLPFLYSIFISLPASFPLFTRLFFFCLSFFILFLLLLLFSSFW